MATRIKSSQIADGAIVAADLHSAIAINTSSAIETTSSGTFGSVIVDDIAIDGATLYLNSTNVSNHLTIDAPEDIILDSQQVRFFDAATGATPTLTPGTEYLSVFSQVNSPIIQSQKVDGSLSIKGKWTDPNGNVYATGGLHFDFSNQGRATFNENLTVGGRLQVNSDLQVNGNTTLGNASTDTVATPGVLSVTNTTTSTSSSTGALIVSGGAGIAENLNVGGDVIVTGNLTVEGSQVTLETTALDVEDKNITLNYHATADTSASADGAGITIQDAVNSTTDATILWNATNDAFDFSHPITVDGTAIIDGGVGVATSGTLIVQQKGDTYNDGIAITSSHSNSARIYKDANSNLHIYNTGGGVDDFVLDNSGNLGLGVSVPNRQLHVQGSGTTVAIKVEATDSVQSSLDLKNSEGEFRLINDNGELYIYDQTDTAERFRIDGSGNVDVGGDIETQSSFRSAENRHNIRPNILLNFANSKQLDSRVAFSRNSNATYWDGKTYVKAQENLLARSDTFVSGGWSSGTYTVTYNATTAPDGTNTGIKVAPGTTGQGNSIAITSNIGKTADSYVWSMFVKADHSDYPAVALYWNSSGSANVRFNITNGTVISTNNGNGSISGSVIDCGNGWLRLVSIYTGATSTAATFYVLDSTTSWSMSNNPDGVKGIFVWGPQVERNTAVTQYTVSTSGPVIKSAPKLLTAPRNVPRFDHYPATGVSRGLLIEQNAQNLSNYSKDMSQLSQTRGSTQTNLAIAPDGTHTADKFVSDSQAGEHAMIKYFATQANKHYTASVFVKSDGSMSNVALQIYQSSGIQGNNVGRFNLTNGTITYGEDWSTIEHVGNDWYRISVTDYATAVVTGTFWIYNCADDASGTIHHQGNNYKGLLYWGHQIEIGNFPSSFIHTDGTVTTRNGDYAKVENWTNYFNTNEGTFFTDIHVPYDLATDAATRYFAQVQGSTFLSIYKNSQSTSVNTYDGVTGHSRSFQTGDNKFIAGYSVDAAIKSIGANNLSISTGALNGPSWNNYETNNELVFGQENNNIGWIRKLAYYPNYLSVTQQKTLIED